MKAFITTIAILAATAFVAAPASAAETPGALASYKLPIGATNLKQGHAVAAVVSEDFQKAIQALNEKIEKLPEDKKAALIANLDLTVAPEFDADLWENQEAYNAYKKALRETKIQPTQDVLVSLQPLGNDEWRINSITVDQNQKAAPLTIGALRYNARNNVWISNNGELRANPYTTTEDCMYGAQTGTQWSMEKSDDISSITEKIRFTKTADGKFIYISYDFQEKSVISGASIARGGYVLRFPVK